MTIHRKALSGTALAVLAVLFVALMLLVNFAFRGARVDLTHNRLHTLSEGTTRILGSIEEPINLYLFYSDRATRDLPQLRTYFTRVREMLQEMESRAGGKLRLEVIDPLPFSEDEDRATGGVDLERGIYPIIKMCTADGHTDATEADIAACYREILAARAAGGNR